MKKKIVLLLSLIVMLMCFFAIVVSAEEYTLVDNLGTPSWYTGNYELMTDKTSKVVLSNGDGTYTAYPAYYILKYSITVSDGKISKAVISDFDYSFVNEKAEKSYDYGAIYKIEIPSGITQIDKDLFGDHDGGIKETTVTEIIMSDTVTSISAHAFRSAPNLKKVVFSKYLVKMGEASFLNCSNLEQIVFPAGSTAVLDMSANDLFRNCSKLQSVDLSTRNVNQLGSHCFNGCTLLGEVKLPDTIVSFGGQCFYYCENMYFASDFLPTSLTSVGFHFMTGAKHANSVLYFPEGFTALSTTHAFAEGKYYNENGLTLVFLGKMTNIELGQYRQSSSGKLKIILTQNDYSDLAGETVTIIEENGTLGFISQSGNGTAITEKTGTLTINMCDSNFPASNSKWKTVDGITYNYVNRDAYEIYFCNGDDIELCYGLRSDNIDGALHKCFTPPVTYSKDDHIKAGVHYDITRVVSLANCGYDGIVSHTCVACDRVENDVDPATGDHTLVDCSACADKCTTCLKYVEKATQNHNLDEIMEYANGFDKLGKHSVICTNEGCTHADTEDIDALFENRGYSYPEDGNSVGISIRFIIDKDAVKAYEDFTGSKINYGLFAGLETSLGNNDVLDENGNQVDGIIVADLTEGAFTVFEIKMMGFAEAQATTPFAIGAYVTETNGGTKKYSYLQGGTPAENQKYCYVTYGDFAK